MVTMVFSVSFSFHGAQRSVSCAAVVWLKTLL